MKNIDKYQTVIVLIKTSFPGYYQETKLVQLLSIVLIKGSMKSLEVLEAGRSKIRRQLKKLITVVTLTVLNYNQVILLPKQCKEKEMKRERINKTLKTLIK